MPKRPVRKRSPIWQGFLIALFFLFALGMGAGAGILAGYFRAAPSLDQVKFDPPLTTYLYDSKGRTLGRLFIENRVEVTIDRIPQHMQDAIIAIEDTQFYRHHGINFLAIARALLADIKGGSAVQGGSTITQQLAKNAFLSPEKTLSRKIQEALWAIQIERKYSKQEILETYLNEIYFGHGAYGVEAAAQTYFGKSADKLTLEESALLAGLVRGPALYSPFKHPEAARNRRNLVLSRMAELGYISPAEAERAKNAPIKLADRTSRRAIAPYFIDYVRQQLLAKYGEHKVYTGGLKVYTSLDLDVQRAAEAAVELLPVSKVDAKGVSQPQIAIVALDPHTGEIKAMVGGRGDDKFNRAVMAYRQPGSAIKPFIYTAAIDHGYTASTIIEDSPVEFRMPNGDVYSPKNFDGTFRGPITLRQAIEESVNVVTVKLLNAIGPRLAIDYAKRMGVSSLIEKGTKNDVNLALGLGGITKGVTPLEMASAYAVLANQGIRVEPIAILKVVDSNGTVLEENRATKQVVLSEQTSYIMTDMMRGVIERGTGKRANIGRPAAGKTGTTDDNADAWFVGFTPDLVAAVWIGNDMRSPLVVKGVRLGSWKAAEIWGAFMRQALAGSPVKAFPKPSGIVDEIAIDTRTGALATPECPRENVRYEVFVEGTQPTRYCDEHKGESNPLKSLLEGLGLGGSAGSESGAAGGAADGGQAGRNEERAPSELPQIDHSDSVAPLGGGGEAE